MSTITLPHTLISAVQEQRAVLFLGAGASFGALHPKGLKVPLGEKLRDQICDKFFDGELKHRPLAAVASMAALEVGLIHFQKYIRDIFEDFNPAPHHELLPTFRWRAIATTNFDLIVERAYRTSRRSVQNLVVSWKDGDLFDNRKNEHANPVGYYKLHGCIDHYTDESIPLILGQEQYASYLNNRHRFYGRMRELGHEYPIIFCGCSISDPHIQQFLFDMTDRSVKRPTYYNVDPSLSDHEVRYWGTHQVTAVVATFEQFIGSLDQKISATARSLSRDISSADLSIKPFYHLPNVTESDEFRSFIENDVKHLHSGFVSERQEAAEFYRGYDTGFGFIQQDLDIDRHINDSILVDAILIDDSERKNGEFYLIKGPAGNGKSVTLKRVAWESAVSYDKLVFYSDSAASLRFDRWKELFEITGKRMFLFIDRVSLYRDEIALLLRSARSSKIPLTVVGAERENEWHIYCEGLESFVAQEFSVTYLTRDEIEELLQKLETHRALGLLSERTLPERIDLFQKRAQKQLLVALHETTLGLPFEKIIFDEYDRVRPREAQALYLNISALHQFGAPVRAGLISRAAGITFREFSEKFLRPLSEVVLVEEDTHGNADLMYKTRHQHVAELVFNQVAPSGEEKYDLLSKMMQYINIDYTSDRETFSRLIRGRALAAMFSNADLARLLYDHADKIARDESFVFHQRAVFEMAHAQGSLQLAEKAADRAAQLNPRSSSIRHTQAEISRRQAIAASDPLLKQSLRRKARYSLSRQTGPASDYEATTRAKVAIDELRELLAKPTAKGDGSDPAIVEAIKDAETAIQRNREEFPDSPEVHATEADLRDLLNQTPQAMTALEKAFKLNPRQDWLAIRLSRRYEDMGRADRAVEVIQTSLKENPQSKHSHLRLAHLMMRYGGGKATLLDHLKASFSFGDNNFEAQFWYGRELFITANKEYESIFESISSRAPGRFRTGASAEIANEAGEFTAFEGTVQRKEEGYAFVNIPHFSGDIFASRGDSSRSEWDKLRSGTAIRCNIGFSRRGARAINITLQRR